MTRGKIFIVSDSNLKRGMVRESVEFNGDMYLEGNGLNVIDHVRKALSEGHDPEGAVMDWDLTSFGKGGPLFMSRPLMTLEAISTVDNPPKLYIKFDEKSYFDLYFSDYLYWVNASNWLVIFNDTQGNKMALAHGEVGVFYFGKRHSKFFPKG